MEDPTPKQIAIEVMQWEFRAWSGEGLNGYTYHGEYVEGHTEFYIGDVEPREIKTADGRVLTVTKGKVAEGNWNPFENEEHDIQVFNHALTCKDQLHAKQLIVMLGALWESRGCHSLDVEECYRVGDYSRAAWELSDKLTDVLGYRPYTEL